MLSRGFNTTRAAAQTMIISGATGPKPPSQVAVSRRAEAAPISNQEALNREKARQSAAEAQKASLDKLREEIAAKLKAKGLSDAVKMVVDERGLVVNIVTDKVLFDNGKADLRKDGTKVLDLIAPIIKGLPNAITVEGHTDNVPISGTYASNWELSATRATTVLRHLVADKVPAKRISAAGYADQRPLDTNQTEAGKARNRRVAIVVLPLVSLTGSGVDNSDQTPAIPGAKPDPGLTTKAAAAAPRS